MTEKHEHDEHEEEDFDFDYGEGVFTDNESVETLRKSAQALGINPDLVAPQAPDGEGPQYRYFARKNCGSCYGRGTIDVVISPSKQKVFWRNEGLPGRVTKRKITSKKKLKRRARRRHKDAAIRAVGPTPKKRKLITGVSPGNELENQWDTRRSEPLGYKADNLSKSFCRCIRAVEV
jgi:hypothetical protein